jgi:hypothetical protein
MKSFGSCVGRRCQSLENSCQGFPVFGKVFLTAVPGASRRKQIFGNWLLAATVATAAVLLATPAAAQTTIAQWNFNGTTTATFNQPSSGTTTTGSTFGVGQSTPALPFSFVLETGTLTDPGTMVGSTNYNRSQTVNPPLISASNGAVGVGYFTPTTGMAAGHPVKISWSQTVGFRSSRYWQLLVSTSGTNGPFTAPSGGVGSSISQFIHGYNSATSSISGTGTVNVSSTGLIDIRTINSNWLSHAVTTNGTIPSPLIAGFIDNISYTLPLDQGYENNTNFAFAIVGLWDPSLSATNGNTGLVSSFAGTDSFDTANGYNRSLSSGGSMRLDMVTVAGVGESSSMNYTVNVVSVHGTTEPGVGEQVYAQGTVITNTVTTPDTQGTTQYVATGWTLSNHEPASGVGTQVVITVTNDATLTWQWTTNFWLDTAAGPNGAVDVADGWQAAGATVQIEALPDAYYAFEAWSGDASGNDNPLDLIMAGPRSIMASFVALGTTNSSIPLWWLAGFGLTNDIESVVDEDTDGDGYTNAEEFIMDTDPTAAGSFLAVQEFGPAFGTNCRVDVWTNDVPPYEVVTNIQCDVTGIVLSWPVSTNRIYAMETSELVWPADWQVVPGMSGIAPVSGLLTITNEIDGVRRVWRMRVGLPE